MLPDHYATLGIAPHSEPVAIRGAYLQLMRRYHPDRNSSAAGEARARAITLAYAVLGVAERRAAYDVHRTRLLAAERLANMPQRQQWQLGPLLRMFFGIGLFMLLLPLLLSPSTVQPERPGLRSNVAAGQEALALEQDQNSTSRAAQPVQVVADRTNMVSLSPNPAVAMSVTDVVPERPVPHLPNGAAAPEQVARAGGQAKLGQQIATTAEPPPARLAHAQRSQPMGEAPKPRAAASTPVKAAAQAVQSPPPEQLLKPAWLRPLPPTQPAWLRPLPPLTPKMATASARASDGQ